VDGRIREEGVEDGKTCLDELGGLPVVGKVNAVEEVGTVAGVNGDRCRESSFGEPCGNLFGPLEGGGVLCSCRGDAARPDGVKVDGKPAAVVASVRERRCFTRFARRERSAGFTSLRVT
jgi:hypothetical protein